jgi:glycerophosphoryl diester phosphodiesterase
MLIAHAAGNSADAVERAIAAGADAVEADLYAQRDHFEVRHERSLFPLPVLVERWYVRRRPRRPMRLVNLLDLVGGRCAVLLDLKSGGPRSAHILERVLREAPDGTDLAVSSQFWYMVRAVNAAHTSIPALYSIDVRAKLDLFMSVAERDRQAAGVSIRHTLLDRPTAETLQERGMIVAAWTVDDVDRARELAEWGVDAITTNRIEDAIAAFRERP